MFKYNQIVIFDWGTWNLRKFKIRPQKLNESTDNGTNSENGNQRNGKVATKLQGWKSRTGKVVKYKEKTNRIKWNARYSRHIPKGYTHMHVIQIIRLMSTEQDITRASLVMYLLSVVTNEHQSITQTHTGTFMYFISHFISFHISRSSQVRQVCSWTRETLSSINGDSMRY